MRVAFLFMCQLYRYVSSLGTDGTIINNTRLCMYFARKIKDYSGTEPNNGTLFFIPGRKGWYKRSGRTLVFFIFVFYVLFFSFLDS